jgi:hypothetical protein
MLRDRYVNDITVGSAYTVPLDMDYVYADAIDGPFAVTLRRTHDRVIREVTIQKVDASANAVTVTDGTLSYELLVENEAAILRQKSTGLWFVASSSVAVS